MNEPIPIPVEHLGVSYEFPLTLVQFGYAYQLRIEVKGQLLIFEKDDAGKYRVISNAGEQRPVDKSLIGSIIATLEELLK
jgi:hypothetical protein